MVTVEQSDGFGWKYSDEWSGPRKPALLSGSIDITNGLVVGVGTFFTTELTEKCYIICNDYVYRVLSIVDDLNAVVDINVNQTAQNFTTLEDVDALEWRKKKSSLLKSESEITACVQNIDTALTVIIDTITLYAVKLYEGYQPRADYTLQSIKVGDTSESYKDEKSCLDRFPADVQALIKPFMASSFGGNISNTGSCCE